MWNFLSASCTLTGTVLTLVPVVYLSWYALRAREWNPLQTGQPGLKEILAEPYEFFTAIATEFKPWHFYCFVTGFALLVIGGAIDLVRAVPESWYRPG